MSPQANEPVSLRETILVDKTPATRLRGMDAVISSETIHAERISATGARPVALRGCQSYLAPLTPCRTRARIKGLDGTPVHPGEVYRVELTLTLLDPTEKVVLSQLLLPEEVMSTELRRDWDSDVIGYQFSHDLDGSYLVRGGVRYQAMYVFHFHGVEGGFPITNTIHVEGARRRVGY